MPDGNDGTPTAADRGPRIQTKDAVQVLFVLVFTTLAFIASDHVLRGIFASLVTAIMLYYFLESVAKIDASTCIGCSRCVVACHDGAHQCIHPAPNGGHVPVVDESECVGCNLCAIVCPVPDCIEMVAVDNGFDETTWNQHLSDGASIRPKKGSHGYDMPN